MVSSAVVPMIAYENGVAALDWLSRVFGFRERTRMLGPDGRLAHGEMEAGDGLIMLATPTPESRKFGLRMLARWPDEFIQPLNASSGVG